MTDVTTGADALLRTLARWNDTTTDYPRDLPVHAVFEEWADRTPDAPALRLPDRTLTYRALDVRANRLAHHLRDVGVGAEARVGVYLRPGAEWVVCALAALKAGAGYVPLDPSYPQPRLELMCRDAGVDVVLLTGDLADRLPAGLDRPVLLDDPELRLDVLPAHRPDVRVHPDQLAYVMFTSGSTGRPKGVAVTHRGVVRTVRNTTYVDVGPADVVVQAATISFDAATYETWVALLNGALLVPLPPQDVLVPERLGQRLREHGVSVLFLTTALAHQLAQEAPGVFAGLRHLMFGGERADRAAVQRLLAHCPDTEIRNAYGPTESTVIVTTHRCGDLTDTDAVVPIGRPIANTSAYVLDDLLRPVRPGDLGELYAGGDGVARGYLGHPRLTAERFLPDPFTTRPGARMYRTGDLVRQRPDGVVEFVGRVDSQVKIRGFRVEPGEVEQCLRDSGLVTETVVRAVRQDDGELILVAYAVPRDGVDAEALRAHARRTLPPHLVPGALVTVPRFPLTPSGKVDVAALPRPDRDTGAASTGTVTARPRTPTERVLVGIWCEVLGRRTVGIHDSFVDLGGHSLKASRLRSRASATLGVDLPLRLVFDHPTVAELAAAVDRIAASDPPDPDPSAPAALAPDGLAPLALGQRQMWLLSQLRPNSPIYHVAQRFDLTGAVDVDALDMALRAVADRHPALRTVFPLVDGEPRQQVLPPGTHGIRLRVVDLAAADATRLNSLLDVAAREPFDLATGPLVRVTLVRTDPELAVLLVCLHHIACDGWSMRIIYDELAACYAAHRAGTTPQLPPALPFAEVAADQERRLETRRRDLLARWEQALAGAPTALDLPTDRRRVAVLDDTGDRVTARWSPGLAQALSDLARRARLTPFVVLMAAFQALVYRHTGQRDVLVGSPVAGRTLLASEGVVGPFVNTLVVRGRIDDGTTFRQLLGQVRDTVLTALGDQELPFEFLVDRFCPNRDPGTQPLFQVMLAVEDGAAERLELPGLTARGTEWHTGTAKFDLTLALLPAPDQVEVRLEYRTQLFDRDTAHRFVERLERLLAAGLADPDRRVADLPLAGPEELAALRRAGAAAEPPEADPRAFPQQVRDWVVRTPDAPAVTLGCRTLSYRDLDRRARSVAAALLAAGAGAETLVGVHLRSSPDLVASFLGVLAAGAVYAPLDPTLPAERLRQVVADAGIGVVLGAPSSADLLRDLPVRVLPVDGLDWEAAPLVSELEPELEPVALDAAAYLIHTSGSTGRPKGVVATHRGLRSLAVGQRALLDVRPGERVLQFHSVGFDVSVSEMVTALSAGAELRLLGPDERAPGPDLAEALRRHDITVADLPPLTLGLMDPGTLPRLRSLTVGGEPCPVDVADAWSRGRELVNAYGPTETTVTATTARLTPGAESVPIGRPVPGARVYVLDAQLAPVPIGIAGDLYVGGPGVARGYLGDPALTAARFLPDPFADVAGTRMYRTGDVVRWLPTGILEFLGRRDGQVKIRGHRIELGEVEARLRGCAGVRRAGVALRQDRPGQPRLVGYLVAEGDQAPLGADVLRGQLRRHLPEWMVPDTFVVVDDLPMTAGGKLDVTALPVPGPERPVLGTGFVAPVSGTQGLVAGIWRELLGLERVGIHDNFFDLGGNSLLLARMRARLEAAVGRQVPTLELFRHPTVAMLARYLSDPAQPPGADPDSAAGARSPGGRDGQAAAGRRALAERGRRARGAGRQVRP
ncbi:MAG: amino acid adenylation domain-containing protein [Actinobacteria bacterium]|nr:amino acid adenylation domain-containing protein [Actinomycetota bacterium]